MAHTRQSKPDYGLNIQVEVLETFQFPLRSGAVPLPSEIFDH